MADGLSVNGLNLMTTIVHDLSHRSAALMKITHWEHICDCIKKMHLLYLRGGFYAQQKYTIEEFKKALSLFRDN